jgi:hypothetical protein
VGNASSQDSFVIFSAHVLELIMSADSVLMVEFPAFLEIKAYYFTNLRERKKASDHSRGITLNGSWLLRQS